MDREELTKDRSVARCIVEGYHLFGTHLLTTFRKVWIPLMATSLAFSLTVVTALGRQWVVAAVFALLALVALWLLKRATFSLVAPFPKIGKGASRVLRHLGRYLCYALLSGIVCIVVFALLFLPAIILLMAGHIDHTLMMAGDEASLGTSYWALTACTLTVCFALTLFAQIWQTFGVIYLYGSMVARDNARRRKLTSHQPTRQNPA